MKKVLVVSNNPASNTENNGKTLNFLFSGWPSDRLAQIYFNNEVPTGSSFDNFYKLTGLDQLMANISYNNRCSAGRSISRSSPVGRPSLRSGFISFFKKVINKRFEALKLLARDFSFFGIGGNSRVLRWIDSFNPECIFLVAGNCCFSIDFAVYVSKVKSIPIILYITDDYLISGQAVGPLSDFHRRKLTVRFHKVFSESKCVFVISEYMAKAYFDKFGVTCNTLVNCARVDLRRRPVRTNECLRFVYSGGLHLGRYLSIIQFARILKIAASKLNVTYQFDVFSGQGLDKNKEYEFHENSINFQGGVDWMALQDELISSDFLLHVESFEPENVRKTMFSVSTKLPEYLSSGSCVIAYGPKDVASIRFIKDNFLGVVLSENDDESVKLLMSVIKSKRQRSRYADRSRSYFDTYLAPEVQQAKLYNLINED